MAAIGSVIFLSSLLSPTSSFAAEHLAVDPVPPEIAKASSEPAEAMAAIRIPEGWEIDVWAAEPDVANVVAFDIDLQGNLYACETFRQNRGVTDNRGHDEAWLLADLASKTVQDRIDYHKRLLGEAAITYAQHDDRVRRLTDSDGDGRADKSVVYANGFNRLEEGTGAGVLALGNDVYYTCIPKLWKLIDEDKDGVSDQRHSLSDGYGVRVAFRGHDLHGLIRGYDGRLYFSIGDRGYHIRTAEGTMLADPASGAVFRCELDGSGLEVFATGLRNPQELAFNDQGDWFTVDNNSDSGDQARIVHLLQDGDTGWRMYYQYLPDRGPFNREKIWEPSNDQQPASIIPPVANFTDGPSGLAYYPGTGFGDQLKDSFLICDFRGGPSNSGIRSFQVQPKGGTFELIADDQPIWTCLATDLAFGPDGAMYVSDWVDGWDGLGKARVYRIHDPEHIDSEIVAETRSLLSGDWNSRSIDDLATGLGHADRRVRLESQWELAKRDELDALASVATSNEADAKARLHAVWGIGQIARAATTTQSDSTESDSTAAKSALLGLLADDDPDLLAAVLKIAGELAWLEAGDAAVEFVGNTETRLRYAAIETLGRIKHDASTEQVLNAHHKLDAADPAMRHAVAMYLSRALTSERIETLAKHPSDAIRLAAVVALGRQKGEQVQTFLTDKNPRVSLEAARIIHDRPIKFAMKALAAQIEDTMDSEPMTRRVLNANYRQGTAENAMALAKYATQAETPEWARIEALSMLGEWAKPDPRDRVLGDYRPLAEREASEAAKAIEPQIDLLMAAPEKVRLKSIEVASHLGIKRIAGELAKQSVQVDRSNDSRAQALTALARLDAKKATELADAMTTETRGPLGRAVLNILSEHAAQRSIKRFVAATNEGDTALRQNAWDILGKRSEPAALTAISEAVNQYLNGKLDPKVQLNVIQAAQGRLSKEQSELLNKHRDVISQTDPLGKWLDSLAGGDVERGKTLFLGKTELSCVRCHKVDRAGGEVGPNLTTIGKQRDARYLLESICLPDAQIAKGFETAVIVDIDGKVVSGIVKSENDDDVELILADGSLTRINQDDIEARKKGNSSMPGDLIKQITPRELRDLVAYLESLKVDPRAEGDVE